MRSSFTFAQPQKASIWRHLINLLLIASGAFTLLARPSIVELTRAEKLNSFFILLGPALFSFFLALFAISTFFASKRKRRPVSAITLVFGALLLTIMIPESIREYNARKTPKIASFAFFKDLQHSQDARIRALLVLSASCTTNSDEDWSKIINKGLGDADPLVQEAAKYAISQKIGQPIAADAEGLEHAKNMLETWNSKDFMANKNIP